MSGKSEKKHRKSKGKVYVIDGDFTFLEQLEQVFDELDRKYGIERKKAKDDRERKLRGDS